MKSSSLGARLFEGLVQPILGSLWKSPPATAENSGDRNIVNVKRTPVQPPVLRDQRASGYTGAPTVRSSAYQQRHGSCGNAATRVVATGKSLSLNRPHSVPTRSSSNGVTLANAVASSETIAPYTGTPPATERGSHKRQKRAPRRQTACRLREGQRAIRETSSSHAAAATGTRCVTRHRIGDAAVAASTASAPVVTSQRTRRQREEGSSEFTRKLGAVVSCGGHQSTGEELGAPPTAAEGTKASTKDVAISPPTVHAVDASGSREWDALPRVAGGVAYSCSEQGRSRNNYRGPGNCGPTSRTGLGSCRKCAFGNDCSSSSSWGGDECVFASEKKSLSLGRNMDHMDVDRSEQTLWATIRAESEGQHPQKKQLPRGLKQQHGEAPRDLGAFKYAVSLEEGPPADVLLHSCHSDTPSASCASLADSCSAGPPSCRLQCSDTTTTCSGSSMTTCGDSRDTATGSAAMAAEHQPQYLEIEEQMPPAFPTTPAEDPPGTTCSKSAACPCGRNNEPVSYASSLEPASTASSCPYVDEAVQTCSNSSAPVALISSASTTAESIQYGNGECSLISSQLSLLPPTREEEQGAAGSAVNETSKNVQAHYAVVPNSTRNPLQQNSAAGVAAASKNNILVPVPVGPVDDCSQVQIANAADDNEIHREQQEQQQRRQSEGLAAGSVIFGHRVLKPLRSKCLEENYDALVEIVAFTKRRCERETMELLRKDVHILYYARGLHHAAHVETYMRQQQNKQQEKQQQEGSASSTNTAMTSSTASQNMPSTHPVPQATCATAPHAATSMDTASADNKRNAAAPCFPSVSAALAGGARPQAVPDWATPEALRDALERQQCYDPFSIFGEAPPELLLSEVYDEQHYTHISPQTRASHPVLARLKHQRSAALMAVFQQKRAALARTQQLLEHELRQLQQQQQQQRVIASSSSQQHGLLDHGGLSSMLGRAVLSFSSGIAAVKSGATTMKTEMNGKDRGHVSSLQLKTMDQSGENTANKDKEALLRQQQRDVLLQQQLLERRLGEQLQQEERIHAELLRNGFRFLAGRINGGESGAALFRKRVLPALESWWQQQCQVELDWRNDPLTSEECSWYREVMNASVDASDLISVQQACFCPTPPPYRQWTWTDCRFRQRQQHEQNLARQRQEQEIQQQQQLAGGKDGSPTAVEWIGRANAEQCDVEEIAEADKCVASEEEMSADTAADCDELVLVQEGAAAEQRPHAKLADAAGEQNCAHHTVGGGSGAQKQDEQPLSKRTPSRKSRKRRAQEGDRTPQGYGNNVEAPGSDRETAGGESNSGSARKRPRSFCRHVKNISLQRGQTDGSSQNVQTVAECSNGRCAYSSRLQRKVNFTKQHVCPTSATKSDSVFPASASPVAPEADKNCPPTGNVRSTGANAGVTHWQQQSLFQLSGKTSTTETNGNAAVTVGTRSDVSDRGTGRGILSPPCCGRQNGHTFSTPAAKVQAAKLSKQQRFISTVPVQEAQLRDRSRQQHPCSASFALPSNKTAVLRQVASPRDQSFVSPIPAAATTKTQACHLLSSWRGNSGPVNSVGMVWDRKAGTADTTECSAVAGGAGSSVAGAGGDAQCNVAARGVPDASFSTLAGETRGRATKTLKQLKMSAAQRRPKQLQKQGIRSAGATQAQESCLSTCKAGAGVQLTASTRTHSQRLAAAVREMTTRKCALAEQAASVFTGKGTPAGDSPMIKSLYLPRGGNLRASTLQTTRGPRLSIDRVYGCRRISDFLHGRTRSQLVLQSLAHPTITFATGKGDTCGVPVDDICKKDIECINSGAL